MEIMNKIDPLLATQLTKTPDLADLRQLLNSLKLS